MLCKEDNADSAAKCENCGHVFANALTASPVLVMTDLKSGKVIKISDSCIIGRSGNIETEYFAEDLYISEYHCKVILENCEYRIEYLPSTNPTKINDMELTKALHSKIIRSGDYLTIADKKFEILIYNDIVHETALPESAIPDIKPSVDKTTYSVTCPKCGFEYEVHNANDRINECKYCDDYDKHEISGIGAKIKHAS
jgi:ribosomal protein L37AE/L43A